jgi:nitrilase
MSDDFCMGGSIIVSPTGEIINGPLLGKEGCLHATIDMDELIRSRLDFDPAGHYHRPDIYQLRNLRK